jgi:hypothetical protein
LDLFTLRHSVCSFFCFGSLAVDPVGGALNYVIALLLPPIHPGSFVKLVLYVDDIAQIHLIHFLEILDHHPGLERNSTNLNSIQATSYK